MMLEKRSKKTRKGNPALYAQPDHQSRMAIENRKISRETRAQDEIIVGWVFRRSRLGCRTCWWIWQSATVMPTHKGDIILVPQVEKLWSELKVARSGPLHGKRMGVQGAGITSYGIPWNYDLRPALFFACNEWVPSGKKCLLGKIGLSTRTIAACSGLANARESFVATRPPNTFFVVSVAAFHLLRSPSSVAKLVCCRVFERYPSFLCVVVVRLGFPFIAC